MPRLSVRPHGTTRLPMDGFLLNFMLSIFRKSAEKIKVLLESDQNSGYLTCTRMYVRDNSLNPS
jgi:hypothetical protein